MTDRPLLFSAPMIRALLDGRKTQTRRLLKGAPVEPAYQAVLNERDQWRFVADTPDLRGDEGADLRFEVGDRIWVKETWSGIFWSPEDIDGRAREYHETPKVERTKDLSSGVFYREDEQRKPWRLQFVPEVQWTPSIFMPRWASRLTLTVTDVRVQRLQEISWGDAIAEGCPGTIGPNPDFPDEWDPSPPEEYAALWDSINDPAGCGPKGWMANPWIVAISFTVEQCNIEKMQKEQAA